MYSEQTITTGNTWRTQVTVYRLFVKRNVETDETPVGAASARPYFTLYVHTLWP